MAKFRATDKITKNPHRSCVILWGLVFLLFLIYGWRWWRGVAANAANGFKSAALFKTIGRRIYPHKVLWGRVQMLTH